MEQFADKDLSEQDVATLMWALATLDLRPRNELQRTMSRRAVATKRGFTPQGLSNLMRALASLDIEPGSPLLRTVLSQRGPVRLPEHREPHVGARDAARHGGADGRAGRGDAEAVSASGCGAAFETATRLESDVGAGKLWD